MAHLGNGKLVLSFVFLVLLTSWSFEAAIILGGGVARFGIAGLVALMWIPGFLLPKMIAADVTHPYFASGIVWAVWHLPLIAFGGFYQTTNTFLMVVAYAMSIVAMNFVISELRVRPGSFSSSRFPHSSLPGQEDARGFGRFWVGIAALLSRCFMQSHISAFTAAQYPSAVRNHASARDLRRRGSVSITMTGHADPSEARTPNQVLAASFDPERLPSAFFDDPYPTYAALRAYEPVHRCADGGHFLTRFDDVAVVYRDRAHFSSDKRAVFGPKYGPESALYAHHTTSLVFNDPPYHTRVRRQIVGALSPAAIKGMTPGLTVLIDHLCDDIERKREADLIEDFAAAIPVEVIGNLLCVPRDERSALRRWSLGILGALDPALPPQVLENGNRCVTEFVEFTQALVSERRRRMRGGDDLLSRLIRDEVEGEHLNEFELVHNCIFLLNAGHETTTNLIGNGLALLLSNARPRQLLAQDASLIGTAVEECLRFESPNQLGNRLVVAPVEVNGRLFTTGAYLTLCIGAANRDPAVFNDPDRFDITRNPNPHLAFGAGSHACAGMSVARLEGQMAIAGFLRRFPRARLAPGAVRSRRARFRGFVSLPAVVE